MKKLFILMFFVCLNIFAQDITEMLNSEDLIQKKLGIRQAAQKPELETKIIEMFKTDTNLEVQMEAARVLGAYKKESCLNVLLEVLKTTDSEDLQSSIIQALINYSDKESAVNAILDILKNGKTEFTRSIAAQTIVDIKTEPVVDALLEALNDNSPIVRKKAANTLGEIGNKKAIPKLQELEKSDPDNEVKSYVVTALRKMGVENENLKSTSTALIFGLIPINGLGLWYADSKILAVTNFLVECAAVGMIFYGYDSINDTNDKNQLKEPSKHYIGLAGFTLLVSGYLFDIIYPVYSVSKFNEKQEIKTTFKPSFFTNGEFTVVGFSLDF